MKTDKGFSLVEMMIVIAIISILASISSFAWQRYVNNSNLKTAARDLASDMASARQKAVTEGLNYRMTVSVGIPGSYTIEKRNADNTVSTVLATKIPTASGAGLSINSTNHAGNIIYFYTRGTASPGNVVLQNSRGSTATVTNNATGKTHVTFTMQ